MRYGIKKISNIDPFHVMTVTVGNRRSGEFRRVELIPGREYVFRAIGAPKHRNNGRRGTLIGFAKYMEPDHLCAVVVFQNTGRQCKVDPGNLDDVEGISANECN